MLIKVGVQVLGHADVLEHPLELVGVLKATGLLQLGNHGGLGVVAGRHVLDQTLGQHLAVELLEHVLVLDVLEDDHDLVERVLQFGLLGIFAGLFQQNITILGQQFGTLAVLVGLAGHTVGVDELAAGLVQGGHEAAVVTEGRHHQGVVLLVYIQDCADV